MCRELDMALCRHADPLMNLGLCFALNYSLCALFQNLFSDFPFLAAFLPYSSKPQTLSVRLNFNSGSLHHVNRYCFVIYVVVPVTQGVLKKVFLILCGLCSQNMSDFLRQGLGRLWGQFSVDLTYSGANQILIWTGISLLTSTTIFRQVIEFGGLTLPQIAECKVNASLVDRLHPLTKYLNFSHKN